MLFSVFPHTVTNLRINGEFNGYIQWVFGSDQKMSGKFWYKKTSVGKDRGFLYFAAERITSTRSNWLVKILGSFAQCSPVKFLWDIPRSMRPYWCSFQNLLRPFVLPYP